MNIAEIVGPVDVYSAGVIIAFAGGATITLSILLARFQTTRKTDQEFELEKLKLSNQESVNKRASDVDREVRLSTISTNKEVEFKRIDSGLIDLKPN